MVTFQKVQYFQDGDALSGRWYLPNFVAAISRTDRLYPSRSVIGEILQRKQSAGNCESIAVDGYQYQGINGLGTESRIPRVEPRILPSWGTVKTAPVDVKKKVDESKKR